MARPIRPQALRELVASLMMSRLYFELSLSDRLALVKRLLGPRAN